MVIEYRIFHLICAQMKNHKLFKRVEFLDSLYFSRLYFYIFFLFCFPKEIAQQTYPIIKFKQKELQVTFPLN